MFVAGSLFLTQVFLLLICYCTIDVICVEAQIPSQFSLCNQIQFSKVNFNYGAQVNRNRYRPSLLLSSLLTHDHRTRHI